MDRDKLKGKLEQIYHEDGLNGVKKFIDEQGIDSEDLDFGFGSYVSDHSKTVWKAKHKFIKVFQSELTKLMDNKQIDIEMLGFILLLSRYIGYEDNILYNDNDDYLNQNDLMKITGWGRTKVSNMINTLMENKVLFKIPHEYDKRKHKYYFDPRLAFKGRKIDKSIFKEFNKE